MYRRPTLKVLNKGKRFFFECRLEDLPRLLRLLPGL